MAKVDDKTLERELKALANRRRLAIIRHLHSKSEATVGELAEAIKLSFKSTSRHLSVLKSADLVEHDQRGLMYFYSLTRPFSIVIKNIL